MISLRADNRNLTKNAKYSFLRTNYLSGVSEMVLTNSVGFVADTRILIVLLGEWGSETSEIMQVDIGSVTSATHTLTFTTATKFAHPESTKVYVLNYNQVKFYQTAADTFSESENALGTEEIQADNLFTTYQDSTNTTGYGWFKFYNSTSTAFASEESNPIPYANFSESTTKKILDNFYSLLNDKERRQIDTDTAYGFLNESLAIMTNELNLVNGNFTASTSTTISITSSTAEYDLESDFSDVITVYDSTNKKEIYSIDIDKIADWQQNSANDIRYYLRGNKIGFSPTPTASTSYLNRYKSLSSIYDTYDDVADLPDKAWYALKYGMLAIACIKLGRTDGEIFKEKFNEGIARMKMISHRRNNQIDSFIPDRSSMI